MVTDSTMAIVEVYFAPRLPIRGFWSEFEANEGICMSGGTIYNWATLNSVMGIDGALP